VKELRATGIPAGMMPGVPYHVGTVEFPPGSLLFVFTDGIPEAAVNKEFYDEERMLQSVRRRFEQPIEEVASGILDDLYDFLGKTPPGDDITMLLLRRKA
jgi:serine phosphatase RsbU (regulator of sigma subunit)